MSSRTIMVVFLALVSGAGMAVGVLQSNRTKNTDETVSVETEQVLMAVRTLERGKAITEDDVESKPWPEKYVPPNAFSDSEQVIGRVAIGQILAGEPILEPKLAPKDAGLGLAAIVPEGKRAFTVMTARVAANVAGFVLPGNKVDVLLNLRGGGRGDETGGGSTTTLLQAIEVLAVDQILEAPAENKVDTRGLASVTLLVTPEEANLLDLGQNMGTLSLSLRNPSDYGDALVEPATVANARFRGLPPSSPMAPGSPSRFFDGDVAPSPEALALLQAVAAPVERRESKWIDTMRGTQRGRVVLSER